jgi:hypothetical protein
MLELIIWRQSACKPPVAFKVQARIEEIIQHIQLYVSNLQKAAATPALDGVKNASKIGSSLMGMNGCG